MGNEITVAGESRVWLAEFGAGPGHAFVYQGCMKIGDTSWPQGDITRIECPSPDRRNEFVEVAAVQGAQERVSTELMGRYPRDISTLLELTRRRCRFDIQVHVGRCKSPQDYLGGWDKIKVYREATVTEWSDENAGAIESGEQNPTNETGAISAKDLYEIVPIAFAEKAKTEVVREVVAAVICDSASCGDCENPSKGCEKAFFLMGGTGATPGTKPAVVFTGDGGVTWGVSYVDSMFSDETPTGLACVGGYLVAISETTTGLHYASIDEILAGTETWVEMTTGFVGAIEPFAIASAGARATWIVGEDGYIFFVLDPTVSAEVQDEGVATSQDLADIAALDGRNVVAVGASNAVVFTDNGGVTWQSVTGPSVGVNLTAVVMLGASLWLVGNANGALYFTENAGVSWTQISLPGTPTVIRDIKFVDDVVGYLAFDAAGPAGRIARTVDGGATWYILPEKAVSGVIPANDRINEIAVCRDNVNLIFAGGLSDLSTDGIIIKAA